MIISDDADGTPVAKQLSHQEFVDDSDAEVVKGGFYEKRFTESFTATTTGLVLSVLRNQGARRTVLSSATASTTWISFGTDTAGGSCMSQSQRSAPITALPKEFQP